MNIDLRNGNCLDVLKTIETNSIDSIVTDPPYEIGFMGKAWDSTGIAYNETMWGECLRVLKPGGHLLSFSATRTYHRMACAIENAGFEIRDMIEWVYGCLSDDTEILTKNGWEQFRISKKSSIFAEQEILIYDTENDLYKWEKPQRWNEYNLHKDTAYRIKSDTTNQIVSRNHRCLVERDGKLVFVKAEQLDKMELVPILSNDLFSKDKRESEVLQLSVQRAGTWSGMETARTQRQGCVDGGNERELQIEPNRSEESSMERWFNLYETQREICRPENKIFKMSAGVYANGKKGRLCNGTQVECCKADKKTVNTDGVCASHKPRCNGQQDRELNAIQNECGTQKVRTRTSYNTTLATVEPIEYSGIIFCPTVSTGAFVARRNGKIFLTGNSGFPKSLNIGKAVDKLQGDERESLGIAKGMGNNNTESMINGVGKSSEFNQEYELSKGTSEFEGWGTALKPAHENIIVAQKTIQCGSAHEKLFVSLLKKIKIELCQQQSFAKIAQSSLMLSRQGLKEELSIAQWIVSENTDIQADLYALTDMLQSASMENTNWNTVLSWLNILGGLYTAKNTYTTLTELSMITELSILNSLEWGSIFQNIMQALNNKVDGNNANVYIAENILNVVGLKLNDILIRFAQESATLQASRINFAPNLEPICMARKPLSEKTVALNCLKWGTGGINIDDSRVEGIDAANAKRLGKSYRTENTNEGQVYGKYKEIAVVRGNLNGRFPANLIHDGSDEVLDCFPETKSGGGLTKNVPDSASVYGKYGVVETMKPTDQGNASRFFKSIIYQAKASKSERGVTNNHPTVKPVALMAYLINLVTPENGIVLDPFMGSGTTGVASKQNNKKFIGIELDNHNFEISKNRINNFLL